MAIGYRNWKAIIDLRQREAQAAAAQATADTAAADAAAAQSDATSALADAATADSAAGAAQTAADDAQEDVNALEATVAGVTQQTEQLFNAAGQVATPVATPIPYSGGFQIVWACTTPGNTLYKRLNGGSWSAYSGSITLSPGDLSEAYATASGLTDSEIASYEA